MKKLIHLCSVLLLVGVLFSCSNECKEYGEYFGEQIAYRSDFLWSKYVPDTLKQTLVFEQENEPYTKPIKLGLFETTNDPETGKEIERPVGDEICLFVNGELQKGTQFVVKPEMKELELGVVFNREFLKKQFDGGERDYYWELKVLDFGDLDMVNENLTSGEIPVLLTWKAEYSTKMNPLVKGLIWTGILIAVLLMLWFTLIRRMVFPTFAFDFLQVFYSQNGSRTGQEECSLHGARKIICSADSKHQSWLNRLFCGRVEYLTAPFWTTTVEMKPCGTDGIAVNEDFKASNADTYCMPPIITSLNGPGRPFVVKHYTQNEKVAEIFIS